MTQLSTINIIQHVQHSKAERITVTVMLYCDIFYYGVVWCVMLCYVVSCYVMLCYAIVTVTLKSQQHLSYSYATVTVMLQLQLQYNTVQHKAVRHWALLFERG